MIYRCLCMPVRILRAYLSPIGVEFCFCRGRLKFEDEVHEWHDLLVIVRIEFYGKLLTADRY